jgi:glucose-1-phosphatase
MTSSSIRNIIFDLGGVILNIDHTLLEATFEKIGIRNFQNQYSKAIQSDIFEKFEKGIISPAVFRNELRRFIQTEISDNQLNDAWNSILLDIPEKRVRLVEKLKDRYRTFMLSNTNAIHYEVYTRELKEKYGYQDFNALFERASFSFQLGVRKPSFEIFRHVIVENQLDPAHTLFIDDSWQHILAAKHLGIMTFHLPAEKDVTELFDPETLDFIGNR